MLLRFRVENWASLRDEQELSLIAADQHDDLALREVPGTDFRVLPAVGVFGANASGKSQLMYAMFYARSAVLESHQRWEPNGSTGREPFRLDQARSTEPTTFVFDLVAEGVRYEYGFALDDTRVLEEWLFSWPQDRGGPSQQPAGLGGSSEQPSAVDRDLRVVPENRHRS